VVCEGFVELGEPLAEQLLDHMGDLTVNRFPLFFEHAVVHHLLGQGVLEHVLELRLKGPGADQVEPLQPGEVLVDVILQLGHPLQDFVQKRPPDDRGLLENPPRLFLETIEPCQDHPVDRGGYVGLPERTGKLPPPIVPDQRFRLDQGVDHLLQIEGIPFRLLPDETLQLQGYIPGFQQGSRHLQGFRWRQVLQADLPVRIPHGAEQVAGEKCEGRPVHAEKEGRMPSLRQKGPE
jgi:hypothetical protein